VKLLILSDIHGNLPALEAVLKLKARGTPWHSAATSLIMVRTRLSACAGLPSTPSIGCGVITTTPWPMTPIVGAWDRFEPIL